MENEKNVNFSKELLNFRKLLKLSQEDFAKMSAMTLEEVKDFENGIGVTVLRRAKICFALERVLRYHSGRLPEIVENRITYLMEIINPFDTLEDFREITSLSQTVNEGIDKFRQVRQEQEHQRHVR